MKPNPERRSAPTRSEQTAATSEPVASGSAELDEERERELAASDDGALVRYLGRWERAVRRLQRAHPERWRVRGLSEDEVCDALALQLLEALRDPAQLAAAAPPGRPWALWIMARQLRVLRQAFRLDATLADLERTPVPDRGPSQEERWLSLEADARRGVAGERAERQLSQPQRRWLGAMHSAAVGGSFFQASDRLNLSAAARLLGKDRSSAQRAYESLQTCFQRELDRLE